MYLYIVRHGQAKPKNEDPERSLSDEGLEEVKRIAEFLSANHVTAKTIYHSNKERARQTAEIIAKVLGLTDVVKVGEGLHPLDDITPWTERINNFDEDIMVVGHLPFLSKLASNILNKDPGRSIFDFETGGVVRLMREGHEFWCIQWMVNPRILS